MMVTCISLVIILCISVPFRVKAYIVSTQSLPRSKQLSWLKSLTESFCSTAPGEITLEMMNSAPDIIQAWVNMDDKENVIKMESVVKRVIDERRFGNLDANVSVQCYNLLLEGWARSKAGAPAAERCEQIVVHMQENSDVSPNLDSFKMVLMAWRASDSPSSAYRAQSFLEYMINLYSSGKNFLACPDSDCFDICLQLWARGGAIEAPQKTELLVLAMERLHMATKLKKLQPKTTSFNAVLNAWSKSNDPLSAKHCLDILRFMESHAKLGDTSIQPDMVSYGTCIMTLSRHNYAVEKAEALLRRMEKIAIDSKLKISPDTITYNSVLGCCARQTESRSYLNARAILDGQIHYYEQSKLHSSKPDVYGFTSVLTACASETKEKMKAFQVAQATFQELCESQDYGRPNHVTYGTMMKCCARLLPQTSPLRRRWVELVMKKAIDAGCVGELVMGRFREAATPDLFREIMEGVDKKNLPDSWTRNVDEKREGKKRWRKSQSRRQAEV
jgi:hypothetical protein